MSFMKSRTREYDIPKLGNSTFPTHPCKVRYKINTSTYFPMEVRYLLH